MKTLNGLVEQACLTAPRAPTALTVDVSRQLLYWASLNTEMVVTVSQVEYSWSGCGNRWVGVRRGEWWDLGECGSGSGTGRVGRREGEERREKKEVRDRMGKSRKVGMRERREKEGRRGEEKRCNCIQTSLHYFSSCSPQTHTVPDIPLRYSTSASYMHVCCCSVNMEDKSFKEWEEGAYDLC